MSFFYQETMPAGVTFLNYNYIAGGNKTMECEKVGMMIGLTVNLGNYESTKIEVWYEKLVDPKNSIGETFDVVKQELHTQLEKATKELVAKYK